MRFLAFAVVFAVEQIIRADRHLLVVLLLGLVGRDNLSVHRLVIDLFVVDYLIIDAARCGSFLVRSLFINVLIVANDGIAGVHVLSRSRTVLRTSIVGHYVLT